MSPGLDADNGGIIDSSMKLGVVVWLVGDA
jgi:hypothetical protein